MKNVVDFDRFTKNYNVLLGEGTRFFSADDAYFAKYKIDIVRKQILCPISSMLEYGCGIGRNIPFLQCAFPTAKIVGSDVSSESLTVASEQCPGVMFFQEKDEEEPREAVDLIFVANVFHHIPPIMRAKVMKKLFHRLKPGGHIFLFEHNPYNPVTRRLVKVCPYDKDAVLLAPSELKNHLKQAGFLNLQQAFCLFFPPKFSRLVLLESYLSKLPLGGQYWVKAKKSD